VPLPVYHTLVHDRMGVTHIFIHFISFTFNSRLKAHAVDYAGKNTLTVKIKN